MYYSLSAVYSDLEKRRQNKRVTILLTDRHMIVLGLWSTPSVELTFDAKYHITVSLAEPVEFKHCLKTKLSSA